jgi:hypothetical protein
MHDIQYIPRACISVDALVSRTIGIIEPADRANDMANGDLSHLWYIPGVVVTVAALLRYNYDLWWDGGSRGLEAQRSKCMTRARLHNWLPRMKKTCVAYTKKYSGWPINRSRPAVIAVRREDTLALYSTTL